MSAETPAGQTPRPTGCGAPGTPRSAFENPLPFIIELTSRVVRIRTDPVRTYREASTEANEKQVKTGSRPSVPAMGRNPPAVGASCPSIRL
jgi:hypothetical protein